MTVIGLGKVGCNIGLKFKGAGYDFVAIDRTVVPDQTSPEAFERDFPETKIKTLLKNIEEPILLIVCGANLISAITLRVLELLKTKEVSVLYINPHSHQLTSVQRLNEKVVHNVLQQYARRGNFKMMYMIDNNLVEKYIGNIPIIGYFDKINDVIFQTIVVIFALIENGPIMGTNPAPIDVCRLATVGVVSPANEVALFNNIAQVRQLHYVFAINEERLKTDGTLLKAIRDQVTSNKISTTYGIYPTNYENEYTYCIAYTNVLSEKK